MKPWMKYILFGIILFPILFFLIGVQGPFLPNSAEMTIINFEGVDSNQNGKIDSITIQIVNTGFVAEEIIAVELSRMNKTWILTDREYPIPVAVLDFVNLSLIAETDQDQFSTNEQIFIDFYLKSEGLLNPAFTINKNDLLIQSEEFFTLKIEITYEKDYTYPFSIEFYWRLIIFCFIISFSPLGFFLIREKIKSYKNKMNTE